MLPRNLVGIIDKAREKDRGLRYQSATEMRADLLSERDYAFWETSAAGRVTRHNGCD